MAQQRIFKQRQRGGQSQPINPEPLPRSTFDTTQSKQISGGAQNTLNNIDEVLNNVDNSPSPVPDDMKPDFTRDALPNSEARDAKQRRIAAAEVQAARQQTRRTPASLADQESQAKPFGDAESLYAQSRANRQKGKRRGIFIGFGAGGGILSVVAGFGFILPFKLPGIMDTLINDAGKRVEKVVESRAEKVILQYIIRGSASGTDIIATGNPIGDLFANIRTSSFEARLKDKYGLSFERSESSGAVRIMHNGKSLGDFKNASQLEEFLNVGNTEHLDASELRKVVKLLVRDEIPAWRFFKRAKFVKWLRLKYDIPRFGAREKAVGENDEDYKKGVAQEHYEAGQNANLKNMEDFVNCAGESGDCKDLNKAGGADDLNKGAQEASEAIGKQVGEDIAKGVTKGSTKLLTSKMTVLLGAASIPFFGEIDIAARLAHGLGNLVTNDLLQKKHAEYIKRSAGVLGALYAGYSDQNKAGDLPAVAVGMFADRLTGWEESKSYSLINNGTTTGTDIEPMTKINETIPVPAFAEFTKTMFGTVGWIGRAPLELWYISVSKVIDTVGGVFGDVSAWAINHIPGIKDLMKSLIGFIGDIFEGLMKLVGMFIDPAAVSGPLAMYIHEGFLGSFNDHGEELGMRKLDHDQALAMDTEIHQDHTETLANESFADRIFNVANPDSLAAHFVMGMPSTSDTSMFGDMAEGALALVGNTPANIAKATSGTAYAAQTPTVTSEELFGGKAYGGLPADLAAPLDPSVAQSPSEQKDCPKPDDNNFNHCLVDRNVVDSMNCVFIKCHDLVAENEANDPLFADVTGPLYGPDAVAPTDYNYGVRLTWNDMLKSMGMVAAILPVAALELSRRNIV